MYRWAKRIWGTISVHERQALLSGGTGGRRSESLMDRLMMGRSPDKEWLRSKTRVVLSDDESERLERWTAADLGGISGWAGKERAFGLEVPREYGGLGLSPLFHARFLRRLATVDREGDWLHRVMVPNSLGPAQLLLRHGTEEQKQRIIPRLVTGEWTPCFGLTGPWNGSDAGAIRDEGVLEERDGVMGIRFSCEKRWITLSPEADLIGLAVRVPPHGITLLLAEADAIRSSLEVRRHRPIGSQFPNGHILVRDAWIPVETAVIGGAPNLGKGWSMLMECLQQGRGISLPSVSDGASACVLWKTVFYALTRRQFSRPLIEIGAIQSLIADMTIRAYLGRILCEMYHATHEGSSAFSALMKLVLTEYSREILRNGMDIFAGKGITMGDRNPIVHFYLQNPIGITVEGSNPLTRHLIVPAQSLFEHHSALATLLTTLEREDPAAFYQNVAMKIPEIALTSLRAIVPGNEIRRRTAQLGLESYACLFRGASLRNDQLVSSVFADHIIGTILLYAIEWSNLHLPEIQDAILQQEARAFIDRTYFDGGRPLRRTPLHPFLQAQHRPVEHISRLLLTHHSFREWIEQDLVLTTNDEPLRRVADLWSRHRGTIREFAIPIDLQREVIDVDSFEK